MELSDYLRVLHRGWLLVLALTAVGLAVGVAFTALTTKVYQASVQIFVATSVGATPADLSAGNTFTSDRVQSYTSITNSPDVTEPVVKQLGLRLSPNQLAGKISADAPLNKVLINLRVTDESPQEAARLANAVAAQFDTVVENIEQTGADDKPVVKLTVIHPATVPTTPIKPSKIINIGLGLALGLLIGFGVVVIRDLLDNTVKDPHDFEKLGVPVLGVIPFDKRTSKVPVAFRGDAHSARSEAYRQLRTNMQFVNVDDPPRVIAVTSAVPREGKSVTAINFAAALAETGAKVCLVEADLRRPTLAESLGLVGDVGLTTVLIGQASIESVMQHVAPNLSVLTSGPVPPNPSELLISAHAREVIKRIAAEMDFTIIDTPPLLPVTDAAEIATIADATLVVVRSGKTTRDQAARSIEALAKVGERSIGGILNMVTRAGRQNTGYYYDEYRPKGQRADAKSTGGSGNPPPSPSGAPQDPELGPHSVLDTPSPQNS